MLLEATERKGTTGERGKRFTMLTAITTVKRISVVCANMAGFSLARFCMPVHHGLRLSRAARKPSRTAHRGRKKTVRPAPFGSAFLSALDEAQHVSGMRARRSVGAERVGEKNCPKEELWRSLLPGRLTSKLRPWFYQSGSLPMGWQTRAEWASERHGEGGILHFALRRAAAASLPFPLPPQAEPGRLPTKPANSTHSPSLLFAQPGKPKASQPAKAAPSPHCQPASGQNRRPPNVTRDDTHTHKKGEAKKRTKTKCNWFRELRRRQLPSVTEEPRQMA